MRALDTYRRFDAMPSEPLIGREHSGVREAEHAAHASAMLEAALILRDLKPQSVAPRARTFEEQLALVEAGRARIYEWSGL